MQIDPNTIVAGRAGTQASLTPELDQLLAALKLQVGQKVEARVAQILVVTEAEKQQLLAARGADKSSQGQQTLLSLLRTPNVKLVELTIRDQPVTTFTNLPLARDSQIQVLVTPRGLMLLPAGPPPAVQPPSSPPLPAGLPLVQSPSAPSTSSTGAPQTAPLIVVRPAAIGNPETPPTTDKLAGLARPTPPIAPSPVALPDKAAAVSERPSAGINLSNVESRQLAPQPVATSPPKAVLAAATSQALPIAQPLKTLLDAVDSTQRLIARAPSQPAGSPVTELGSLLAKVSRLAVDVTKVSPDTIRQAMNTSGLFYERRLIAENGVGREREIQSPPLSERDIKGLLIQLAQWNPGQAPAALTPGAAQSSTDTLAQLMMSLARLWNPRQAPTKGEPAQRQLSHAVQELAEKSLAQVQLQQFRTLSSQLQDGPAPAQWHLDIPLKLPDAYGNLYMQLFEPRVAADEKKPAGQRKSRKSGGGRWRVFLELELDQLGALAAEIAVQEKIVEATLWSGNDDLRQRVHAQLENLRGDLERQGIEVADLRCSANPPPEQKIRLDYALIDVKT